MADSATGRLALDLETISPNVPPDRKPDFSNPRQFEVFIVGVGYQSEPGKPIDVEALVRTGIGPDAELNVIERALDWIDERDADTLLTYNGDEFDLGLLLERTRIAAEESTAGRRELLDRVNALLERCESDDLKPACWDAFGDYTRFEDACAVAGVDCPTTHWAEYDHPMEPDNWRRPEHRGKSELVNADVPEFGERYLRLLDAGNEGEPVVEELHRMLTEYTLGDVKPLFELADARPFDGNGDESKSPPIAE